MVTIKIRIAFAISSDFPIHHKVFFIRIFWIIRVRKIHSGLSRCVILIPQMQGPGKLICYLFVNKKIILIWFPWFWFPISNTDYAQGMSEFMTKSSYKISSLFIGRQNSVRIYPPAIFDVITTRPHILANPYYAISIFSFRQSIM